MKVRHLVFVAWLSVALAVTAGCAALQNRDPLNVTVAGIEPLQGEGMELRLLVKLRVQNPNDAPIDFDGVAVEMNVQGKTFATGVSDAKGSVPRFGESIIEVPVTASAFRMARQAIDLMKGGGAGLNKISYQMKGKLSGTGFSAVRFQNQGDFELPTDAAAGGT
ncbi:MAG TPA: LEA type 2 family protein [Steroidobacteraceae bacterium]|nr:LEA type 2 family protein [Steroidobacteraceae bacterium]